MESVSLSELVILVTTDQESFQSYTGDLIHFLKDSSE